MCEDILYHIMTRLQGQSTASSPSEYHLNILKATEFWNIILRATGSVSKLNSNSFVKRTKASINELGGLLLEKTIDMKLLQQLLEYSDEKLFQHFDSAVSKKKNLGDMIVSREEIAKLRRLCENYQHDQRILDILVKFYSEFCSTAQITDVYDYIQDVRLHMQYSDKIKLKQVLETNYWTFHEKILESAKRCYKFNRSQTFRNVFDACLQEDVTATKVEYIAQKLIPTVFEKYEAMCKQFKEWEKLKCSDASLLWKNVTNVNSELDLMDGYKTHKSQRFVQTLDHLSKIPHWIERLEQLEKVVDIFKIPHNEDDWLSKSIRLLKDDSMKLGQINNFFDFLDKNLSRVNKDCWKLIRELSSADDLMNFFKNISEHDITKYSDEGLIQKDIVLSLIQINQCLVSLLNNDDKMESISDFLDALLLVIKNNITLGEKIALCNNSNMALQNLYIKILERNESTEVIEEKVKNIVTNGIYTFARNERGDKCLVSLEYTSKTKIYNYNLNEILELCEQAHYENDIVNDRDMEMSKTVMDDLVAQIDVAQEIVSLVSVLIQTGHFDYKKFEKKLHGTENMKEYLKFLKDELEKW